MSEDRVKVQGLDKLAEPRIQIEGVEQLSAPNQRIQVEDIDALLAAPAQPPLPAAGEASPPFRSPIARQDTIVQTEGGPILSTGVLGDPDIPTVPTPEELAKYEDYKKGEQSRYDAAKKYPTPADAKTIGEFFKYTGEDIQVKLQPVLNGINSGAASVWDTLDKSAAIISDYTGVDKTELFQRLRDNTPIGTPAVSLGGKIIEQLMGAPFSVAQFVAFGKAGSSLKVLDRVFKTGKSFGNIGKVMGFGTLGAIERYGDGTEEMVKGGMEYALLGMNLQAIAPLAQASRASIMSSIFGGLSVLNDEPTEDVAASFATGWILGLIGGKGDPTLTLSGEVRNAINNTPVIQRMLARTGVKREQGRELEDIATTVVTEHLATSLPSLQDAIKASELGKTSSTVKVNLIKLFDMELNSRLGEKFKDLSTKEKLNAVLERVDKDNIISKRIKKKYVDRTLDALKKAEKQINSNAEAIKDISQLEVNKSADLVNRGYKDADKATIQAEQPLRKRVLNLARRGIIDIKGEMKAAFMKENAVFGKEIVKFQELLAGASARSALVFDRFRASVIEGLPEVDIMNVSKIVFARRALEIANDKELKGKKNIKNPHGATAGDYTRALIKLRQEHGEVKFNKLDQLASNYFEWTRSTVRELEKSGIISKTELENLLKLDWSKRTSIDRIDPERRILPKKKQKIDVRDTGVYQLKGGTTKPIVYDIREIAAQVSVRTIDRVMRNNTNKALYNFAEAVPDNFIVRLPEEGRVKMNKRGNKVKSVRVPRGFTRVDVFIDGIQKPIFLNKAYAEQWVTSNESMPTAVANTLRIVSLGVILRPLATGINPAFALTNFPRDVLHAWLTTNEYSAFLPRFAFQVGKDLMTTYKDAWRKEGRYIEYIEEGGGMSFLTHQGLTSLTGTFGKSVARAEVDASKWGRAKAVLGKLNEMSELWVRLSYRERAIRNGKDKVEATWVARRYIDFAQGGIATKGLDHSFAYLNASVQGIRGIGRQLTNKEDAIRLGAKVSQLAVLEASMQLANYAVNPEAAAMVSTQDQIANWVFTLPLEPWIDSQGNKRYWYITVAKDPSAISMLAPITAVMNKFIYDRVPPSWVRKTFEKSIPMPYTGSAIPSAEAYYGFIANKDMWTGRKIWRGPDVPAKDEVYGFRRGRPATPLIYEAWEALTGLSPVRSEWFVRKMSADNPYVQLMGKGFRTLTEGLSPQDKIDTSEELIRSTPILKKLLKATHPYSVEADMMEDPIRRANAAVSDTNMRFDELYELNTVGQLAGGKGAMEAFVRAQDPVTRNRLIRRQVKRDELERLRGRIGSTSGVPSLSWWFRLALAESNEARAAAYYQAWVSSSNRSGMDRLSNQIQGFNTSGFFQALQKEKREFGMDAR